MLLQALLVAGAAAQVDSRLRGSVGLLDGMGAVAAGAHWRPRIAGGQRLPVHAVSKASDDPLVAPKVAVKFAKGNEKFVILGGVMGDTVLDPKGVSSLASLPSLDEIRGTLIGLIQAPAAKIARVVKAPAGQLARVFAAYGKTGEAA